MINNNILACKLTHLSVMCSNAFSNCGDLQLARVSQVFGENQLTSRIFHIGVKATNQLWVDTLVSMVNLEELVLYNARPSSLRAKFFQLLAVYTSDEGERSTPGELAALLCPLLWRFGLKYDHWLRRREQLT